MSKKKLTLEEAKQILKSDKVFYNGNTKFNVLDVGKYNSGITIEIPQEWTIDKRRKPESPIKYITNPDLTDGMNIDFDGDTSFLLGRYRLSKNGKPVFELTEPTKAQDALIRVSWGGPFNKTRGQSADYAQETSASFFSRRRSNGGGAGCDYWILPVSFVKDMDSRDVSYILENIEKEEKERISKIDDYIEKENLEIHNSIENREQILKQIQPIIQKLQTLNSEFKFEAQTENFIYSQNTYLSSKTSKYSDNLVNELNKLLEREIREKSARDTYLPMYQEMESTLYTLNITISYNSTNVTLIDPSSYFYYNTYNYSLDGYNSFINDLTKYQEKIYHDQEETRRKAEELKRASELKIRKDEAQKMGYPKEFEFWNRLSGATNLSHAYVIESDGTIREPDYNNLRNNNHKYKNSDWKNVSDGTQGYVQILPGEVIITYTKTCTAAPYIFNIEWADSKLTDPQLEVICNELLEKGSFAETSTGQKITDIEQWVTSAVQLKYIECRKQLNLEENIIEHGKDDGFVEEIVEYAKQLIEEKDKNTKAKELAESYEQHLSNNPLSWEDK